MSEYENELPGEDLTDAPGVRQPYEAPRVVESATFETLALTCAKTVGVAVCLLPPGFTNS